MVLRTKNYIPFFSQGSEKEIFIICSKIKGKHKIVRIKIFVEIPIVFLWKIKN